MVARAVARYEYTDASRTVLYAVVRQADKRFYMDGDVSARVPYRLPELLHAADLGGECFVVEGEKDTDRLRHELRSWREFTATTSAGGASWQWPADWSSYFVGLQAVHVIADNDEAGRNAALQRARVIAQSVPRVTLLTALPGVPEHGDVSDWLEAGGDVETLYRLCAGAPEIAPLQRATHSRVALLDEYKPAPVQWLWRPWLPRGKLVILDGDPALGKSTLALDIAARVTNGGAFPDGYVDLNGGAQNVLILTAEDGIADTVRPRFIEAGGDSSHAYMLTAAEAKDGLDRAIELPKDVPLLEQVVRETDAVLVVVDVLMAYLGHEVNSHNDANMRSVLMRLSALAEATLTTIICIRHLNKTSGLTAIYRGGGSIGIIGAARAGWIVGVDPENESRRILAMTKNNLAPMPDSLAYSVVRGEQWDTSRIAWHGSVETPANVLVEQHGSRRARADEDPESALSQAATWLLGRLHEGPLAASWAMNEADGLGYSERTVKRAKKLLGVKSRPLVRDGQKEWIWSLDE